MPAASDALHGHLADAFPTTMQAVRLNPPGGLDALSLDHIATPQAGPGEVLVRVHAAAITRDELTWSTDRLPIIPSFEVSGVVAALGTDVTSIRAGEAVFALTPFDRQGVAAEFAAIPAAMLAPKPAGLTDVAAAATPMPALTAWQALFDHGALRAGQRVLITGAAGGVGHVGVQLARWRGAHVIAIAPAARHDLVRQLGANEVTDRQTALTSGGIDPVDLIFDTTGGELLAASPRLLASGGRTVTVVESPPAGVEADYFVVTPNREQLIEMSPLFEAGTIRVLIDSGFPLTQFREAFSRLAKRGKVGKVVLGVVDEST